MSPSPHSTLQVQARNDAFRAAFPLQITLCFAMCLCAALSGDPLIYIVLATALARLLAHTAYGYGQAAMLFVNYIAVVLSLTRTISALRLATAWYSNAEMPLSDISEQRLGTSSANLMLFAVGRVLGDLLTYVLPLPSWVHLSALYSQLISAACEAGVSSDARLALLVVRLTGPLIGSGFVATSRRQAQRLQLAAARSAWRADSRLNHILKNKGAEARFIVEEAVDQLHRLNGLSQNPDQLRSVLSCLAQVFQCNKPGESITEATCRRWRGRAPLFNYLPPPYFTLPGLRVRGNPISIHVCVCVCVCV